MKPVHVTARFRVKPGQVDAAISILAELVEHSRNEDGCIAYGYYRQTDDAEALTSIETWKTPEAEAAHIDTDFLEDAVSRLRPLLDGKPDVKRYRQVL
jgi:quinol monooxygenase YgiN